MKRLLNRRWAGPLVLFAIALAVAVTMTQGSGWNFPM